MLAPFSIAAAAACHHHRPEQTELHAIVAGRYLPMEVEGTAVFFDGMAYTLPPAEFSLAVTLSILDISSIVPQAYRHAAEGQTVLVIGNGIAEGQAELALDLFRTNPDLLDYFNECMAAD